MKTIINALTGVLVLSLSSTALAAQSEGSSRSQAERPLHQRLLVCLDIDSGVERLDCYDRVAASAAQENDGDAVRESAQSRAAANRERADVRQEQALARVAEARQAAEERREQRESNDFGREHRRDFESEDGRRYVEITEAWQNPRGLWRFRLQDGAEWHQLQSGHFQYQEGETYYIERGALNSFRLGLEGSNRNIRIRRVD